MTPLAWRILALFVDQVQTARKGEYGYGYLATWHLCDRLNVPRMTIQAAHVLHGPGNEYERAMRELVDRGLIEEMPNLGERFHLVVKEEKQP